MAAVFLLAHVLTPNKAYRYVIVAIPLMGALAATGLHAIHDRRSARAALLAAALLVALCGWSLATMRTLTFGDIGPYEKTRAAESAFDDVGPVNRLLVVASRQPDLCGLRWRHTISPGRAAIRFSSKCAGYRGGSRRVVRLLHFIIASTAESAGNPVASDGGFVLRRLGPVTCAPDPSYDRKLPGYDAIRQGLGR